MDYEDFGQKVKWLKEEGLKMVISPDLDGILSAMLLHQVLKWKVVGFYNAENLWILKEVANLEEVVFVDHDIFRKRVRSIGHHLLQWSEGIPISEHHPVTSINPNLLRGHTFDKGKGLRRKYPFGTFHFLLACFHAWGMVHSLPPNPDWIFIMLHIDSALRNAFTYPQNALDWLRWMGSLNNSSPLKPICDSLTTLPPVDLLKGIAKVRKKIGKMGFPEGSQCSISDPQNPAQWSRFQKVIEWLNYVTGWRRITLPDFSQEKIEKIEMRRYHCKPTRKNFEEKVIKKRPFSYALISGGEHGLNYCFLPGEGGE